MYISEHQLKWDELHTNQRFLLRHPDESVLRFVESNYDEPRKTHLLDLGCGAGRHVIFLAHQGYRVTGIDFSDQALQFTNSILQEYKLQADLVQGNILALPFDTECFDAVICYGVLYYFYKADIETIVRELYRVMKQGGKAFFVVRSIRDQRYVLGQEVEKNTIVLNDNRTNEQGMRMHFFEPEELNSLFSEFSEIEIGIKEESMYSKEVVNSDYLITVTK
ncbi:class I SAM-dependent methyltransferase [Paenibacillus sp. HJGM_3]|uniref:class I SAM-dependent methyltransferase n=1 Tax=Paenibacillus sp. HJGM_3 TaxID=3379816 RepID=UPI00385BA7B1